MRRRRRRSGKESSRSWGSRSWRSRLLEALSGFIGGLALIVSSFILVFWNENHGLHTAQALQETEQFLVNVSNAPIDPKNNRAPVYFSGLATTSEVLRDSLLGVSQQAIKLVRNVEMYQWEERVEKKAQKEAADSKQEAALYTYGPTWSDQLIKSSQFKEPEKHQNPRHMLLESRTLQAKVVKVGDFNLPQSFVDKMQGSTILDLSHLDLGPLQQKLNKPVQHMEYRIYVGKNPQAPEIGDLKVTVSEILPQTVSIIAEQTGNTVQPYITPIGRPVGLLAMGAQPPEQILQQMEIASKGLTWFFRMLSVLTMILGVALILRPMAVLAGEVPFFENLVEFGLGLLACTGGFILWATATAIVWFSVRPAWSFGLMGVVFLFAYVIFSRQEKEID